MKHTCLTLTTIALTLVLSFSAFEVSAHHSFAMYDTSKTLTVEGTIKEFQWTNPHAVVWILDGPHEDGKEPELWTVELPTSPGNLTRLGWTKHSLNPGERVIVELNPLRDGKHGGSFKKATIVDSGKVLTVNFKDLEEAASQ